MMLAHNLVIAWTHYPSGVHWGIASATTTTRPPPILTSGSYRGRFALASGSCRGRFALLSLSASGEDTHETNSLVVAARKGNLEALAELVHVDHVDVNLGVRCEKIPTMDGATALCWASRQGRVGAVKFLLASKANVNAATHSGWTALYCASLNGHADIVQLLITHGANVAAAFGVNDERTNLNLRRMMDEARNEGRSVAPINPSPSARPPPIPTSAPVSAAPTAAAAAVPVILEPASEGLDWKASARRSASLLPAERADAEVMGAGAFAGMSELAAMKLRLEWRAPPTAEEQSAADGLRQTVYKYRHDRIRELEGGAQMAAAAPSMASAAASIAASADPPSARSSAVASSSAASSAMPGAVGMDASVLARLDVLESRIAAAIDATESAYARGFSEGFAAGRAAE